MFLQYDWEKNLLHYMSLFAYGTSFTEFLRLGRWNNQNNSIRKNTLFVKCNISKTEMQSISNIFF